MASISRKLVWTPRPKTRASRHEAPPPRRTAAIDTLSNATHSGAWQRSQDGMSGSSAAGRPDALNKSTHR